MDCEPGIDWRTLGEQLDADGFAVAEGLLAPGECRDLAALYAQDDRFRSRVVMARHAFGQGEYKYFAYPLPEPVARLRTTLYPPLTEVANRWNAALGIATRYPETHEAYIARCHGAGQRRPTPLLLTYGPGDYNRLHQDVYGELLFPLQMTILLSRPGQDFTGGEFVLTEQRARMQSRAHVVPLNQGDVALFAVRDRPVPSARGASRAVMRHGVSRIRSGRRMTLGVIFHDAA
jgi:hypothetical protein